MKWMSVVDEGIENGNQREPGWITTIQCTASETISVGTRLSMRSMVRVYIYTKNCKWKVEALKMSLAGYRGFF